MKSENSFSILFSILPLSALSPSGFAPFLPLLGHPFTLYSLPPPLLYSAPSPPLPSTTTTILVPGATPSPCVTATSVDASVSVISTAAAAAAGSTETLTPDGKCSAEV